MIAYGYTDRRQRVEAPTILEAQRAASVLAVVDGDAMDPDTWHAVVVEIDGEPYLRYPDVTRRADGTVSTILWADA